jgi:hypothetical protein
MHRYLVAVVLLLLCFVGLTAALASFPAFSFDEGWTATVARNWVERGFYGMYVNGEQASPGLAAAFPATASVAAGFRLFGVGLAQARLVSAMYMLAALAALYALARQLYNARAAVCALPAVVLLAPQWDMQALYVGRSVLAEPVMLLLLSVSYLFFARGVRATSDWRGRGLVALAVIGWSLALNAKAQPLPFWALSLAAGMMYCAVKRQWRDAARVGGALAASLVLMYGWRVLFDVVLRENTVRAEVIPGLLNVTALVTDVEVWRNSVLVLVLTGTPFLVGWGYAAWRWSHSQERNSIGRRMMQLVMLVFVASWTVWFVLLSIGWPRYLFPAAFMGSIFVGMMMDRALTGAPETMTNNGSSPMRRALQVGAAALVVTYAALTVRQLVPQIRADVSAGETTAWLNANLPAGALVETYESEILFGLGPRAHFPPDTLNVEIIRKREIDPELVLSYDARPVNADFLVVGRFGRAFGVYDGLLDNPYVPVTEIGDYRVYQNVKSPPN